MAKRKGAKKSYHRREEKTAPHSVLATIIGASGAAVPFITPNPGTGGRTVLMSLVEAANGAASGDEGAVADGLNTAGQNLVNGTIQGFVPMIGLVGLAALTGWAGRKYGKSSTNLDRKWRMV